MSQNMFYFSWGILGRNPDKNLKSFPSCYSQSHLQLCLEIFLQLTQPLTVSVNEKGRKPYRKPYPLLYGLRNPHRNLKAENSQDGTATKRSITQRSCHLT